ncbi:Guanine nucleotide exchange factor DBS, partial [Armadillidium vulgare]
FELSLFLQMSQIGLTESIKGNKGDNRKFEVWLQGRQEVYTIFAQTAEIKDLWVSEIKKVLLDQFEYLKGENIKQYSSRIQKGASVNGIIVPPHSPTTLHRFNIYSLLTWHINFNNLPIKPNRALRQTASWDIAGSSFSSDSVKNSNCDYEIAKPPNNVMKFSDGSGFTLGSVPGEDEEPSWSSDYSPSDEEPEELETFTEEIESSSSRFVVLADYNAMGSSEVSLRESDSVDLIKVGCAGWWYVKVCGTPYEGWAPAAYLERVMKKGNRSSPSVSSQDSTTELRPATSRSSVASLSNKSEDVVS